MSGDASVLQESKQSVTCSAPGKILLAGGYLVLDPSYTGLVLSLSARIYATILPGFGGGINVYSPQFDQAVWRYSLNRGTVVEDSTQHNPFVREALQTCLLYLSTSQARFDVCIFADNQYYSIKSSSTRFSFSDKTISETPKTGLGSSAALTTSLCAALYLHLSGKSTITTDDTRRIHNLAQIAHCRAQGKVGSGFDVASAVYGNCLYARFPAHVIDDLPSGTGSDAASALRKTVDIAWPMTADQVSLRPGLKVLMGDVSKGSSTPGMVNKVKSSPAAMDVWPSLGISNDLLADYLTGTKPYSRAEERSLRDVTRAVRALLKQMGVEAGVEIEPDDQTTVLDETLLISGVVACGVPGAGGYDAIYAVVEQSSAAENEVNQLWQKHGIKTLDVRDDGKGIQVEQDFDVLQHIRDGLTLPDQSGDSIKDILESATKDRQLR